MTWYPLCGRLGGPQDQPEWLHKILLHQDWIPGPLSYDKSLHQLQNPDPPFLQINAWCLTTAWDKKKKCSACSEAKPTDKCRQNFQCQTYGRFCIMTVFICITPKEHKTFQQKIMPAVHNFINVCNDGHKFCPTFCSSIKGTLHVMVLTTQAIFCSCMVSNTTKLPTQNA